jgi:hypothetical protein
LQLLITTQTQENYAAHDWDGEGVCPQRWKFKGGIDYKYSLGSQVRNAEVLAEIVEHFRPQIEENNDYYRNDIIGWEVVADDYLTEFERSQLDYEGEITYPATRLELKEELSPFETMNS